MSESVNDNVHILANREAFQETYERAKEYFGKFDGVVGVAFGQKYSGTAYKDDISIVIFVKEKKNESAIPAEQRIPASFEGYITDVRVVRTAGFQACDNDAEVTNMAGGIQITGPINMTSGNYGKGTLGCIVRKKNDADRENVFLLTNKHVLFDFGAQPNNYTYHPYPTSPDLAKWQTPGASTSLGPIMAASLLNNVKYTFKLPDGTDKEEDFYADAAYARINIDSKCGESTCTKDVIKYVTMIIDPDHLDDTSTYFEIKDVRSVINDPSIISKKVFKVGRATGKTTGIVRLINAPVMVPVIPGLVATAFEGKNTIEIDFDPTSETTHVNCKGRARFTEEGDSGSVVFDEDNKIIGLHSLGAPDGSPSIFPSNACHILPILNSLGLCIPTTTGTSHCSCNATDGSGLTPAPSSGGTGGGAFGISGSFTQPKKEALPPMLQPQPLSAEQQEHLTDLLQSFRSTAKGRELHGAFAHVRREIGFLIRNQRPVTVAWHRNKGPAFFASMLNHLRGDAIIFPHEISGAKLTMLLDKMEIELNRHGSIPLRETIRQYGDDIRSMLLCGNNVQAFIDYLEKTEPK